MNAFPHLMAIYIYIYIEREKDLLEVMVSLILMAIERKGSIRSNGFSNSNGTCYRRKRFGGRLIGTNSIHACIFAYNCMKFISNSYTCIFI